MMTTPTCSVCPKAKQYMKDNGIDFVAYDIFEDEEAYGRVNEAGYRSVPVFFDSEGNHWTGFKPETLDKYKN